MSFVAREVARIRHLLLSDPNRADWDLLYAAQQALEWSLEPSGIKSPCSLIVDTQEGSEGCLAHEFRIRKACQN
jgi:hypothetical protein